MKQKYYEHFRLLAYAAIFSEMQLLTTNRLNQIKTLLDTFVTQFPLLYGVRILMIAFLFLHFTFFFAFKGTKLCFNCPFSRSCSPNII
jgi:hypothetical protein